MTDPTPGAADDGAWFAPKRFGYGAGLPIRWQGWALLAGYLVFVLPFGWLLSWADAEARVFAIGALIAATFILVLVAKTKTRGGWKWRSGGGD